MKYKFDYSKQKDRILRNTRNICFRDVIEAIKKDGVLDNIDHFNRKKYPNQKIYIIKIGFKVYAVPYVIDRVKGVYFLKTIYPNRDLRKKYLKNHESKNN